MINLDTVKMSDLMFLCAHDFKHDFIEDSEKPRYAFGQAGCGDKTSPEMDSDGKYVKYSETFPLV